MTVGLTREQTFELVTDGAVGREVFARLSGSTHSATYTRTAAFVMTLADTDGNVSVPLSTIGDVRFLYLQVDAPLDVTLGSGVTIPLGRGAAGETSTLRLEGSSVATVVLSNPTTSTTVEVTVIAGGDAGVGGGPTFLSMVAIEDEGVFQGNIDTFDFVGTGVSAAVVGSRVTITVTGGGGGGSWVRDIFTATTGQISFILSQAPSAATSVELSVNGIDYYEPGDWTRSGVTVTWLDTLFTMDGDELVARYQ